MGLDYGCFIEKHAPATPWLSYRRTLNQAMYWVGPQPWYLAPDRFMLWPSLWKRMQLAHFLIVRQSTSYREARQRVCAADMSWSPPGHCRYNQRAAAWWSSQAQPDLRLLQAGYRRWCPRQGWGIHNCQMRHDSNSSMSPNHRELTTL